MLVEILLKLLICIVNIELLKTVYLKREEIFKNAYASSILFSHQGNGSGNNVLKIKFQRR